MATAAQQCLQSPVPTVAAFMLALRAAEGDWHVNGVYYANVEDATIQRRRLAERLQREAVRGISAASAVEGLEIARLVAAGETHCVWCGHPLGERDGVVPIGGKLLHAEPCQVEYDVFTHEDAEVRFELTDAGRRALERDAFRRGYRAGATHEQGRTGHIDC